MKLIIMGPPGSGKGTQAEFISKTYGIAHVSTGAMLRADNERGDDVKKIMASGGFPDDKLIIEIVERRLKQPDAQNGFILDGFPRTEAQAKALEELSPEPMKVLYIYVSDEEIQNRLSNRRSCDACGSIYHLIANPPKEADKCDRCGGTLQLRDDDKPDVIKNRLAVYRKLTEPLITHYKGKGEIAEIDVNGKSVAEVQNMIKLILESK